MKVRGLIASGIGAVVVAGLCMAFTTRDAYAGAQTACPGPYDSCGPTLGVFLDRSDCTLAWDVVSGAGDFTICSAECGDAPPNHWIMGHQEIHHFRFNCGRSPDGTYPGAEGICEKTTVTYGGECSI